MPRQRVYENEMVSDRIVRVRRESRKEKNMLPNIRVRIDRKKQSSMVGHRWKNENKRNINRSFFSSFISNSYFNIAYVIIFDVNTKSNSREDCFTGISFEITMTLVEIDMLYTFRQKSLSAF